MSSALSSLIPTSGLVAGKTATAGADAFLPGAAGLAGLLSSPLFLPLLLSFGPSIFSKLFGGNPQQKLRDQINALIAQRVPETNRLYQGVLGSPAFSQGQSNIATGANQTANTVAANLAARGIGTTGTGAILSGLTPSLVGSQQAGLKTAAYNTASSQFEDELRQRIAALTGTQGPSQTQQLFAGGLESFGPYLQAYLKHRFPTFANIGQQPTGTYAGG